jgi:hypothetical protein
MWAWVVGGSDNAGTWKPLCKITFRLFVQAVHAPKWVSRLDLSPNPKISHVDIWEIWKYFKIPKGLKSKLLLGPSILDKRPLNCILFHQKTEARKPLHRKESPRGIFLSISNWKLPPHPGSCSQAPRGPQRNWGIQGSLQLLPSCPGSRGGGIERPSCCICLECTICET